MGFDMAYYNVQVQQFDVPALAYLYSIAAAVGVQIWSNFGTRFTLILLSWAVKILVHVGNHHIWYTGLDF